MCRTGIAGRTAHRDWAPLAAALLQAADVTSGWRRPSRTTKLLTQYFFHAVAARNRRNPILRLFVLSANSPWTSEAANNFLKKFQKHPPSPKISPHSRPPPKKISFPQVPPESDTLLHWRGLGVFQFRSFAPSCERRFRRSQNAPTSHKIGLGQSTAPTDSSRQRTGQVQGASGAGDPMFSGGGGGSFRPLPDFFSRSLLIKG